jgi:CheY-like chemotaxis protein
LNLLRVLRKELTERRDTTKALVIDDDESLGSLFQLIISAALPHVAVDVAKNGRDAVEQFSQKHHGVLLMDLHMPKMDGGMVFNKISKLCRQRKWEMPSVVFCTGYAPPEMLTRALDASPHCLLRKPVNHETIVREVKARLS